ncbi:helix-turn-helix transcriptional regulator [Actinomadura adrarensis]|uniref:Helix-turn-helix transcriptional regulator n=1 Tax=Actinomadura adrarensis TaxID=1819600 RepID=A0ABW3CS85_9ACTN
MPIVRDPLEPKISLWHFLAFYLRFLREKAGLSLTQCGQIIGVARSTVSNIEAGRQRPQEDQLKKLDAKYGTGRLLQLMLWFARMAHDPDWGRQLIKYEEEAVSIKWYHGQVVPLALQTDDYIRAYVEASTHKDLDAVTARRIARRDAYLERGNSVRTWVVIDEAVLARLVGDCRTMREQLEHLVKVSHLPHVSVRVIPFTSGAHMGVDGSLKIVSLEDRDIAYSGAQNGGRLIESPGEVREMSIMFDSIGVKATSEDASRDLIEQYLERYRDDRAVA